MWKDVYNGGGHANLHLDKSTVTKALNLQVWNKIQKLRLKKLKFGWTTSFSSCKPCLGSSLQTSCSLFVASSPALSFLLNKYQLFQVKFLLFEEARHKSNSTVKSKIKKIRKWLQSSLGISSRLRVFQAPVTAESRKLCDCSTLTSASYMFCQHQQRRLALQSDSFGFGTDMRCKNAVTGIRQ